MAPIVLTTIEPITPYADIPISLNRNPPRNAPTTPVTRSPHSPNPLPRENTPANHPEINPIIKNQNIVIPPSSFSNIYTLSTTIRKYAVIITPPHGIWAENFKIFIGDTNFEGGGNNVLSSLESQY